MSVLRPSRRLHRVTARAAAVTAAVMTALLAFAAPAAAHPTLLTTVPAAGYTGAGPVRSVVLAFDEPVTASPGAVTVTSVADGRVPAGPLRRAAGGRQLVLPLRAPLRTGQFRVRWQVTAEDGDVVDGDFAFGVGTAALTAGSGSGTARLAATTALRWLLFSALALAAGGLVGEWLARPRAARAGLPAVAAPLRSAAAVGAVAAAGLTALVAPAAGGWEALTGVRAVELTAVETIAFALTVLVAALARLRPAAAAPLAAVVVAEGLRAHPDGYAPGWGAALTVVHLAAAAVWVGALVHVVRTARAWSREHRGWGWLLLRAYARVALGLFLLVVATGSVASLLVLRSPADFVTTGYGRVLAGKLVLVAVVTALAVAGRRRIRRDVPGRDLEPGRATRVERSALVAILAVTALLVSLPAPRPTATALTLPPPPMGPTAGFGGLLGQLSLGATASTGQLQLSVSAPGSDPGEPGEAGDLDVHLSVRLDPPGAAPAGVAVRGCGPGCYLASAGWRAGINHVTVTASAPRWHGGTATFTVPWPPVDATGRLRAMLTALRNTRTIALTEGVTSGTTGPTDAQRLHVTGAFFLDSEPFGNGGAATVTELPAGAGGAQRLAVAYPAIGVYMTLTLDAADRPVHEVEATPDHLITRTFTYPTP